MSRLTLLTILGACMGGVLATGTSAQTLQTDPPDAYLRVEGPLTISGRTSFPLDYLPEGEYRVLGRGAGLAASRARFEIDGRGLTSLGWSGPDALIKPPGLAHLEQDESRGWYHLGTATFSGVLWGLGIQDVGDAEDRIQNARAALDLAPDAAARSQADLELSEARTEKTDEERIRNLWGAYFLTSWVGAGLEAWLLTPQATISRASDGARVSLPRASRWGAAGRSALVPGAGQRYLGRDTRANVFSTLIAASAAGAILAQDSFLEARRKESKLERQVALATTPTQRERLRIDLEDAQSDKDTKSLVRWVFAGTAAYFYLWNVIDAYRIGHQAEMATPGPSFSLAPTPEGMSLTLNWRFH